MIRNNWRQFTLNRFNQGIETCLILILAPQRPLWNLLYPLQHADFFRPLKCLCRMSR